MKSFSVTETSFELKLFTLFTSFRISVNVKFLDWANFYYNYESLYFILSRNRNIKKRRLNVILPEWKTKQVKGDLMDLDI